MAQQPNDLYNDKGCILTIGLVVDGEPCQYVMAVTTDASSITDDQLCSDAINSFEDNMFLLMLNTLSAESYIAFGQATGMMPGKIPFRKPYPSTEYAGNLASGAAPSNVACLGVIYADPADNTVPPGRTRVAKTFIVGMPKTLIVSNAVQAPLNANILLLMQAMQDGWTSDLASSSKWYRVLDVPKPTNVRTKCRRLLVGEVRGGVYTQKRRLVPRLN